MVPGGGGARGLHPEWAPCHLANAPELFDVDNDGRVPKTMRELVEGGGQPTVEELLREVGRGAGGGGGGGGAGAVAGAVAGGGAGGATPCSRRGGAVSGSGAGGGQAQWGPR